jgi:hypothetical protein
MILIVSCMQSVGAMWLPFTFLWHVCYVYIQEIYRNEWRKPRWRRHGPWRDAGGMMEITPRSTRCRSNVRRTISYHIIHACDVNTFYASYFA